MSSQHPKTNYEPPFNITRASHLVFTARDLALSKKFYAEVLGLVVSDETDDTVWMHGVEERCHHSLTLKKTKGEPVCERVGFRVFSDNDLTKAKAHFDKVGVESHFVEMPYQGRTLHVSDTAGTPLELVATQQTHDRTQTKTHTHKGASALRMDHYQVLVPDVGLAAQFYLDLGFRISDYAVVGEDKVVAIFMYRKDNPHDMVFLQRSGPRFHHFGYMVQEMHHVVRALDVAGNLGFGASLEHGPGRHGGGHSYYVYLRDPDGHRVELLLPATQIIDIDDEPMRHQVKPGINMNLWGLPPPRTWFEETTPLMGAKVTSPAVQGEPFSLEKYLFARQPQHAAE